MLRLVALLFLALSLTALAAKPEKVAQWRAAQAEFLQGEIPHLALEIGDEEIHALKKDPRNYVEGTLKSGPTAWRHVAIKLKGAQGSFAPIDQKPCFTLNFDKFKGAERFHGFTRIHLNNSREDPSFLRQQLAGEMVRAAGLPALRCTHALVTLNGRDLGLYVLTESYGPDLLAPFFRETDGDLYESGFCKDIDQELSKDHGEKNDFSAIEQLIAASREGDATVRWEKLRAILDVEHFATFLALECLLGIGDGYDFNRNNYRIYHDPQTRRLTFIPHGMDEPLIDARFPVERQSDTIVGQAFSQCPEGRALFRKRLAELHDALFVQRDWRAFVQRESERLLAALAGDHAKLAKELRPKHEQLREMLGERGQFVAEALTREPEAVRFDARGVARLEKGWTSKQEGSAKLERVGGALRIRADGECQASWRLPLELPPGRYRFEAKADASEIAGDGAGLRISGKDPAGEWITGTRPGAALSYEFEAPAGGLVLVAELRAKRGEILFPVKDLQLVRVK